MKSNRTVLKLSELVIRMGNRAHKFKLNKLIEMHGGKECPICEQELPACIEYFHKNNKARTGLQTYCKICQTKTTKKSRKTRQLNANANAEKLIKGRK